MEGGSIQLPRLLLTALAQGPVGQDVVASAEVIPNAVRPASRSGHSKILYPEQLPGFDLSVSELREDSRPQLVARLRASGVDPSRPPRDPDIGELPRTSAP